jgi:molybdopterin synthase sulfur carrier subunit
MDVTIKLFATFQKGRFAIQQREVAQGTRLRTIVDELGIDAAAIGVTMANGRHIEVDYELRPGDVIAVFPVSGGG